MRALLSLLFFFGWLPLLGGSPTTPAPLAGRWRQQQVAFVARRVISHELQEQLDDSATAELNEQLRNGRTVIPLDLAAGGRFRHVCRAGQPDSAAEAGTYRLGHDTLYLRGLQAPTALPPVVRVVRLTRRELVLEFPLWQPADVVYEQRLYRRITN